MIMLQPEHQEIKFPKYRAYTGEVYEDYYTLLKAHPEISVDHPDFDTEKTYHAFYDEEGAIV